LIAHLAQSGIATASQWVLRAAGLPPEARPGAQPKEALDAFWQIYGFLRGEAELAEDARAAQRAFAATNDLAAQNRLIRLTEALDALRRGEAEEADAV
jgi:DNA primase